MTKTKPTLIVALCIATIAIQEAASSSFAAAGSSGAVASAGSGGAFSSAGSSSGGFNYDYVDTNFNHPVAGGSGSSVPVASGAGTGASTLSLRSGSPSKTQSVVVGPNGDTTILQQNGNQSPKIYQIPASSG